MHKEISVITTVYNGEKFIENSVRSILNHTFEEFEYLIIDDGSDDKVRNVYDCSMIRNKTNSGKGYSIKK